MRSLTQTTWTPAKASTIVVHTAVRKNNANARRNLPKRSQRSVTHVPQHRQTQQQPQIARVIESKSKWHVVGLVVLSDVSAEVVRN